MKSLYGLLVSDVEGLWWDTGKVGHLEQQAESSQPEAQAQTRECTGNALGFGTSKPAPSDVLPLSRPHLLNLAPKHQQLETKWWTVRVSELRNSECIKVRGVMTISKMGSSLKIVPWTYKDSFLLRLLATWSLTCTWLVVVWCQHLGTKTTVVLWAWVYTGGVFAAVCLAPCTWVGEVCHGLCRGRSHFKSLLFPKTIQCLPPLAEIK